MGEKHMTSIRTLTIAASFLSLALGHTSAFGSWYDRPVSVENFQDEKVYSPYAGRNYPDQVLFGDTHAHTDLSFDAGLVGTSLGVDEGFRFARGERVISNSGQPVQLIRPLDFLVVTDHAEFIGLAPMIHESHPELLAVPQTSQSVDLFLPGTYNITKRVIP
jgi:hypothetical protein